MRFHVDSDEGEVIRLWVTLDNPSDIPSVSLVSGTRKICSLSANTLRPDLRDLDMHTTGECGFHIDKSVVPELDANLPIEIVEMSSGVQLYGRYKPIKHVRKRMLIWGRGSEVLRRNPSKMLSRFSVVCTNLDDYNLETAQSILGNDACSLLVIGCPNLLRLGEVIERLEFETIFVITDPYIDLSESLIRLAEPTAGAAVEEAYEATDREPLTIETLHDRRKMVRYFRTLGKNEKRRTRSPVVRALTRTPDEEPRRADVPVALKMLARYNVVTTDRMLDMFIDGIEGLSDLGSPSSMDIDVRGIADNLRSIDSVSDLINEDLALYECVGRAVHSALERLKISGIEALKK